MTGLQRILKAHGSIKATNEKGKTVTWLWDYANDKPRLKHEMTKDEITVSEKAKLEGVKKELNNNNG